MTTFVVNFDRERREWARGAHGEWKAKESPETANHLLQFSAGGSPAQIPEDPVSRAPRTRRTGGVYGPHTDPGQTRLFKPILRTVAISLKLCFCSFIYFKVELCWLYFMFNLDALCFAPQVKIWFQNRRSKFKKLWKNGEIPADQQVAAGDSPSSTPPPQAGWDFPPNQTPNDGDTVSEQPTGPPNTTAPSFLTNYSWYSSTNTVTHLQPSPLIQPHHNSAMSAGTIF